VHSWYRWQQDGVVSPDQRPLVDRPEPANKLCVAQRQAVLALCNSPRFGAMRFSSIQIDRLRRKKPRIYWLHKS
jgi:hypothetical protein